MQKSSWLYGGIASLFLVPAFLGIPIGVANGTQFWLLYYVLRGDNPNMFDSGPEILFWILLLLPVLISGFCFYKLFSSKSADEETEF
jgi:hypothetical protein